MFVRSAGYIASRSQALLPDLPYKHGRGEGPGTSKVRKGHVGPPFGGSGQSCASLNTCLNTKVVSLSCTRA